MGRLADSLFGDLNRQDIRYCHWKSNIHIDDGLNGTSDLDILIDSRDHQRFVDVLNAHRCKPMMPGCGGGFPGLSDYLGYDAETGAFLHLHVHTKTITGRSGIKEYHLPVENLCLEDPCMLHGVKVPRPEVELVIHILRMAAKKSLAGFGLDVSRRRSQGQTDGPGLTPESELRHLVDHSNLPCFREILRHDVFNLLAVDVIERIATDPERVLASQLRRIRRSMIPFMRLSPGQVWSRSVMVELRSCLVRVGLLDLKKNLESGGLAFALAGIDGCGKTTLAAKLQQKLGWKLRAQVCVLGSNKFSLRLLPTYCVTDVCKGILTFVFGWLSASRKALARVEYWLETALAKDRLRKCRAADQAVRNGAVVIYERYPLRGVFDFPIRFMPEGKFGTLIDNGRRERLFGLYDKFPGPALVFCLDITPAESARRKPDHDNAVIQAKHDRLSEFLKRPTDVFPDSEIVVLDGTRSQDDIVRDIVKVLWDRL